MVAAAALTAGQYVTLEKSSEKWIVEAVENPTGLVVHLHLAHASCRRPPRELHVFPDQLISVFAR